jgi:hypothetical protein
MRLSFTKAQHPASEERRRFLEIADKATISSYRSLTSLRLPRCDAALKERTSDRCGQYDHLTNHFSLIADAELAFVCESLYACKNRIGIKMRFLDHFRFEAPASPAIVEVGGE